MQLVSVQLRCQSGLSWLHLSVSGMTVRGSPVPLKCECGRPWLHLSGQCTKWTREMFCSIMSVLGAIVEGSFFVLHLLFRQPGAAPTPIWVATPIWVSPGEGTTRGSERACPVAAELATLKCKWSERCGSLYLRLGGQCGLSWLHLSVSGMTVWGSPVPLNPLAS